MAGADGDSPVGIDGEVRRGVHLQLAAIDRQVVSGRRPRRGAEVGVLNDVEYTRIDGGAAGKGVNCASVHGDRAGAVLGQRAGAGSDRIVNGNAASAAQSKVLSAGDGIARSHVQRECVRIRVNARGGIQRDGALIGIVARNVAQRAVRRNTRSAQSQRLRADDNAALNLQGRSARHRHAARRRAQRRGVLSIHDAGVDREGAGERVRGG